MLPATPATQSFVSAPRPPPPRQCFVSAAVVAAPPPPSFVPAPPAFPNGLPPVGLPPVITSPSASTPSAVPPPIASQTSPIFRPEFSVHLAAPAPCFHAPGANPTLHPRDLQRALSNECNAAFDILPRHFCEGSPLKALSPPCSYHQDRDFSC
jgi:hypothetical protein